MFIAEMPRSLCAVGAFLLPSLLIGHLSGARLKADMNNSYKLHLREYKNHDIRKVIPMQQIDIEASHLPLFIRFKSRSSKLKLGQSRASNRPNFQRSNSIEEPILVHAVRKLVLQQIFGSQENVDDGHIQHRELNQYQSPYVLPTVTAAEAMSSEDAKSSEKEDETDGEMYSAVMEDSGDDEPTIESENNELDYVDEPLKRRQYPLMKELQRLATDYMWAQYALQMKHYRLARLQYLKQLKNRHQDMAFGGSRRTAKFVRKQWSPHSATIKRTSSYTNGGQVQLSKGRTLEIPLARKANRRVNLAKNKWKDATKGTLGGQERTDRPRRRGRGHYGGRMSRKSGHAAKKDDQVGKAGWNRSAWWTSVTK